MVMMSANAGNIPMAVWHLNNESVPTGLLAIDDTGEPYRNGSLVNMNAGQWITGKLDKALDFDGINDYVDLGNEFNFELNEQFSFSMWFNTTTTSTDVMLDRYRLNRGWTIYMEAGKITVSFAHSAGNYIKIETDNTYNNGEYHFLFVTYDASSTAAGITVYIDGVPVDVTILKDTLAVTMQAATNSSMGGREAALFYDGILDEVIIWYTEVNQGNITRMYNEGNGIAWSPIDMITPEDGDTEYTSTNVTFAFNVTHRTYELLNCSLYTNETGAWTNRTNVITSTVQNLYIFNYTFETCGIYDWNIACNFTDRTRWCEFNKTFIVRHPELVIQAPNITNAPALIGQPVRIRVNTSFIPACPVTATDDITYFITEISDADGTVRFSNESLFWSYPNNGYMWGYDFTPPGDSATGLWLAKFWAEFYNSTPYREFNFVASEQGDVSIAQTNSTQFCQNDNLVLRNITTVYRSYGCTEESTTQTKTIECEHGCNDRLNLCFTRPENIFLVFVTVLAVTVLAIWLISQLLNV